MEKLSFIEKCVNLIKGDDAKATAIKIQKKASSVLKTEISAQETALLDLEEELLEAVEQTEQARSNYGDLLANKELYIENLISAKNKVTELEESIEEQKELIAFFKKEYEIITK